MVLTEYGDIFSTWTIYLRTSESVQRLGALRFYGVRESVKRRTITKYDVAGCFSTRRDDTNKGSEVPGWVSFRRVFRRRSSSSLINFACLMMCEEKKEGRGEENQREFTVAKHASLSPKFSYIITIIHDESLFFGGKTPPRSDRDRISDGDVSSHRSSVLGCPPNFLWKRGQCRLKERI